MSEVTGLSQMYRTQIMLIKMANLKLVKAAVTLDFKYVKFLWTLQQS